MSSKHFALLLIFAVSAGCTLDRQSPPNVTAVPSYWQPQSQHEQSQLAEMRAFHESESAKMSENLHVFRNHEIERLAATGKDAEKVETVEKVEKEPLRQAEPTKTAEQRKKWTSLNWFSKKSKNDAPLVSETSKKIW